jgi:hypothetical protein
MTNSEMQDTIHKTSVIAYWVGIKEGRKRERAAILKALDWKAEANYIGEYFYLADLEDLLKELDDAEQKRVSE